MQAERRPGQRVRERGQALVEFALIAPVLIAFVLLTVDVGRAYWEAIDAAGAARAGARMGIISDTSDIGSDIRDAPQTLSPPGARKGRERPGVPVVRPVRAAIRMAVPTAPSAAARSPALPSAPASCPMGTSAAALRSAPGEYAR